MREEDRVCGVRCVKEFPSPPRALRLAFAIRYPKVVVACFFSSNNLLQAALQLLSVYEENNPAVDDKDVERMRAVTTGGSLTLRTLSENTAGKSSKRNPFPGESPHDTTKGRGSGRGDKKLKELQRRIYVSGVLWRAT